MNDEMRERITELTEELTYTVMEESPKSKKARKLIKELSVTIPCQLLADGVDKDEAMESVVGTYAGAQVDFFTSQGVDLQEAERMAEVSAFGIFGIELSLSTHKVH